MLWAIAAASIVFWALRLLAPADAVMPPAVASAATATVDPAAVGRLLGVVNSAPAVAAVPDAASRFVLQGVVADTDQQGVALIAVDGKPPRPYRVGAQVAPGYFLQSVDSRVASFGPSLASDSAFTLQLPVKPFAANPPRDDGAAMPGIELSPEADPAAPR